MEQKLTIVIQAGGGSTRMGQDKGLMSFLGQPLIQRVIERVAPTADELLVISNKPDDYQFLGIPIHPDVIPSIGALGGLYSALMIAANPIVAVVACDLPFANQDLLTGCRDILIDTGCDTVIPSTERGLEPLHAVYRKETCLPAVKDSIHAGKRRMIAWHEDVDVRILLPHEVTLFDPHSITFWNVNTPEEFDKAEKKAKEISQVAPKKPYGTL